MYNARQTPKAANNIRGNDKSYSEVFESHCSCPKNFQFKSDQSRDQNKFHSNNSLGKTAKESGKCLRDDLPRYGFTPKAKKSTETKHFSSPRVDINLKNVPKDRIMNVNIRENFCKNRFKSKTEPTLSTERYVEDLKREIQSNKREIPSLSEKYKKKYLTSLKEELYLNKLTTHHDKNQEIEDIKMEIDTYRAQHSPFVPENLQTSKNNSPRELKFNIHHKDNKLNHRREIHNTKVRKEKKTKASDQYDRHVVAQQTDTHEGHKKTKKIVNRDTEEVKKLSPSLRSEEERVESKSPIKSYTTSSIQCEIPTTRRSDYAGDLKVAEKLEAIQHLLPKISSIIERSEKSLENAFKNILKHPKTVQDRAVSPIKDILGLDNVQENKKEIYVAPKTPPSSSRDPEDEPVLDKHPLTSFTSLSSPPKTYVPTAGDLILNIQSIKDNRSLLDGFQNELVQLKCDIEECKDCKSNTRNGGNVNDIRNFCERHAVYIPLLRVGERGSPKDRIKLYNSLKTEAYLKNELDKQIKLIVQLEKKLSKARRNNDSDKLEPLEKQLILAKSYFDNLLVKQQTERVLNEQQKIIEDSAGHECVNIEDCEKCCLERQVHELLGRLRDNIARDLEDSKQRLTIHKMPIIDIRKPLQLQNILKMNIPPSSPPEISPITNTVFEAIIKDEGIDNNSHDQTIQTKVLATSVEVSSYKNKKESSITKEKEHNKQQIVAKIVESEDSAFLNKSPKSSVKSMSLAKTPSEMGFRRNVASQCDSSSSLQALIDRALKVAQTGREDSCYLFGFKDYLMKKLSACPVEQVEASLQVSLDGSFDTVLKSMSTTSADSQSSRLLKVKSEFQEICMVAPRCDRIVKEQQTLPLSSVSTEDEFNRNGSKFRSLQKTSSLQKILPASSGFPESQFSIRNPFTESKYRLKSIPFNKPVSEIEVKRDSGDVFYKSLTYTNELPERKHQTLIASQMCIANISDVHEATTHGSYSEQNGATVLKDDENLKPPSAILKVRDFTFKKKPSTGDEPKPSCMPDSNYIKNLNRIPKDTAKSEEDDKHTAQSATSRNVCRPSFEKKPSFEAEPGRKLTTEEINCESLSLIHKNAIESISDEKNREPSTPSLNTRRTTEKKPCFENEPVHIRIIDDIDQENLKLIQKGDKHKDVSASSRNASPSTLEKKLSFEPEVKPEDLEISSNDSEETQTHHFGNTKPIKETAEVEYSQTSTHQETTMSNSYEAHFEPSGTSKLQPIMVGGKSELDETKKESVENINYSTEEIIKTFDDEDISAQEKQQEQPPMKEQKPKTSQTSIIEVLPPTYKLMVNKNDFHTKLSEKNMSTPNLESSKRTKIIEPSPLSIEKSNEEPGRRYKETKKNISTLFDTDKFDISSSLDSKYKTNIANYIFAVKNTKQTLVNRSCTCKFCSELPRIAQDRLEYSERCSNIDKSVESSIFSSEGEVMANISVGEIRHCPRRKDSSRKNKSVINNKERLSSHLLLEKERKHYNHWVTYYTTKKCKKESNSSSSKSDNINDN